MDNLSPEQVDKALKLCDMLSLEDFTLAVAILQQIDWSIENAIGMLDGHSSSASIDSGDQKEGTVTGEGQAGVQSEGTDSEFQYEIEGQQKKREKQERQAMFNEDFEGFPISRSTSTPPMTLEKKLSFERGLIDGYGRFRHFYQAKLMLNTEKFCQQVLKNRKDTLKQITRNKERNEQNRKFICQLERRYQTKINFTFGTFFLNLVRSYLDKKYLLVYIHRQQSEDSQAVKMLLSQKEISTFINKNCVAYGMFDNSDDYQTVQQHVPMKELPAFAVFKYDRKSQVEKLVNCYPVLQKQPALFMEWLADNLGVGLKKKSPTKAEKENKKQGQEKKKTSVLTHRSIMQMQNQQYEQMERLYNLKRQQSKLQKQQIANAEHMLELKRHRFAHEVQFQPGKTIQVRFRLPWTGQSLRRVFTNQSKVQQMFDYVDCFGRHEFEEKFADFDLTQTFPSLSLFSRRQEALTDVFEGSNYENIIVKEL